MAVDGAVWLGKWQGGRVREARGKRVWVIERRGRTVTLRVASEGQALAELALFDSDPAGYRTRQERAAASPGAVQLDGPTLKAFSDHCIAQGLSEDYRKHILKPYLADWAGAFGRRDLRAVSLRELNERLDVWGS